MPPSSSEEDSVWFWGEQSAQMELMRRRESRPEIATDPEIERAMDAEMERRGVRRRAEIERFWDAEIERYRGTGDSGRRDIARDLADERLRLEEEAAVSAAVAASLACAATSAPEPPAASVPETAVAATSAAAEDDDRGLCKICLDAGIGVVFLPCGHACACAECAAQVDCCPICRSVFASTAKIYLS